MAVLDRIESQLHQIWQDYQRSLKDEAKSKALLQQYRKLHVAYKRQKIVIFG